MTALPLEPHTEAEEAVIGGPCEVCGENPAVITVRFRDTGAMTFRYCAAPACREDLAVSLRAAIAVPVAQAGEGR